MADIFVSYSRRDSDFVRNLCGRLRAEQRDVWVDWEDIPPSAEWLGEIETAIDAADTFVFVLSPDSVASSTCRHELDRAVGSSKRIVPLVLRDVATSSVPDSLSRLHWLFFRDNDDHDAAYRTLLDTVDKDLEWVRAHSRLQVRAREWQTHNDDTSYLLAGTDLEQSERWLAQIVGKQPQPTQLQLAYLAAARTEQTRRQQSQLRGFYLVSLIYGVLQSAVSYFVVFDEISEEGLVALSPLWVLGIVFGLFGLTIGRTSLRRSIIATIGAGALLYLFFITLWGAL